MRFSTIVAATVVATTQAAEFYWKHDSEWATGANWINSNPPGPNTYAAFGVYDSFGSEDPCDQMDTVINVPVDQATGGLVMGKGVDIQLGKGAGLVIGKTEDETVVQWKCKSPQDVDYRCSANWHDGAGNDVKTIPCGQDDIVFEKGSAMVDNAGVPLVNSVTVNNKLMDRPQEIAAVSRMYKGFTAAFVADGTFSTDGMTVMAAELDCTDSCAAQNTLTTEEEKYHAVHDNLVKRQEFIAAALEQMDDNFEANEVERINTKQQADIFGRATLYVFDGAEGKALPTVRVRSYGDAVAYTDELINVVGAHFGKQVGCLRPNNVQFSFTPVNCVALAGFSADDGCGNGNNQYNDACPAEVSQVCAAGQINVATRFATNDAEFNTATCGDFEDVTLWFSATAGQRRTISENCCEAADDVKVVGCGFTTGGLQEKHTVSIFAPSLVETTKNILHGANRGARKSTSGECHASYVATSEVDKYFPVDLTSATAEFLAVNDHDEMDTAVVVNALANADMATALADWDVGDKPDDFDAKFHVKKFRGVNPDRRRRNFNDIKDDIVESLRAELPFGNSLTLDDVIDGSSEKDYDAQILLKGLGVNWFDTDSVALLGPEIEPYIANVMFTYAMEAQEYTLKVEEYAFLTTSTTTTVTYTSTTSTTSPATEPQASGAKKQIGDLCRVTAEKGKCPEDKKVYELQSQVSHAKDIFDILSKIQQDEIDSSDQYIANLEADMESKSNVYKAMKKALDACDKAGIDKISTVSYPDTCNRQKRAYDVASNDFLAFVTSAGGSSDYNSKVSELFSKKARAMSELTNLQTDYMKDLLKMIKYDSVAHAASKSAAEVKDMQSSFTLVADELLNLNDQVELSQRRLAEASGKSTTNKSAMKSALETKKTSVQDAADACDATEKARLADVPAAVLKVGTSIYKEEMELKEATITKTCAPYIAELAQLNKLIGSTDDNYDNLQKETDEAFMQSKDIADDLEAFEEQEKAELQASINDRVEEDEANDFPVLIVVIAGGGALVLILLVALVVSMNKSGGGGGNRDQYSNWGGKNDGSTVAFENPVYAGEDGQYEDAGGDGADEDGGLYDEPEMFGNEEAADNGASAGGGYLDVSPEDDDDDEDEEEDEEEEDEEEDDDEDDDEDDEEEESEEEESEEEDDDDSDDE